MINHMGIINQPLQVKQSVSTSVNRTTKAEVRDSLKAKGAISSVQSPNKANQSNLVIDQTKEKVEGFFIISDVDMVKKEKGPGGVEAVQKMVPELDLKKLSPIKKYPLNQEMVLLRAIAIVLYGDDSPESWEKLGAHELETIKNCTLGKVILSLIGHDFISLIKNSHRLFNVFVPFVVYKCQIINEKKAIVTIENDPYPKEYYLGSFYAFLDMLQIKGTVSVMDGGYRKHIYTVDII